MKKINKVYRYTVLIEPGINRSLHSFKKRVKKTLDDSRSWCVHFVEDEKNPDFLIILSKEATIRESCGFKGLSCADWSENIIYLNYNNWCKGSEKSGLNLEDYRTYVINHEIGHILGLHEHLKPKNGCRVPVMNQSTRGIGKGLPNMWPLKQEQDLVRALHRSDNDCLDILSRGYGFIDRQDWFRSSF